MNTLARKVKAGTINSDEIAVLVEFTKQQGGIEYAERRMEEIAEESRVFIDQYVKEKAIKDALTAYLDYVIQRNY
jgi:octaprenyl-diphosphate synthase